MERESDVVIIGGGIVGLCCAYYLRQTGASVTVLDKGPMEGGASYVNAGYLVPSHIEPMAAPGVIAQGLKWLANPESPFYIKPRIDLDLTRWLWGFQAACTDDHVARSIPILRDLALASLELFDEMALRPGFEGAGPEHTGLLMIHNSEYSKRHNLEFADVAVEAGLDVRQLTREETLTLEPGIRTPLTGSVYCREDSAIDPGYFMARLKDEIISMGVQIRRDTEVTGFRRNGDVITAVRTRSGDIAADHVVLAAGSWSGRLADEAGLKIAIQPATGYSITVDDPAGSMKIPAILTEEKITVGPMRGKIRIAGTLTLVGHDTKIDKVRLRPLERQVGLYFEDIGRGERPMPEARSGFRPCSVDGLPVIGRPKGHKNFFVATGHGMLGFTQGPITGTTIAELVSSGTSMFAGDEISPDRFG
jgi:D-amino-acid dehydrogenase